MLSDLRDSGAIEQDADIVMFIYREELYEKDTDRKGIAEIHVSKHRNGPVGVVDLHFDTETTCFNDVTYRDFDQFDPKQPPRYAAALEDDLFGGNND
jgi:replicative DNA helicase